MDVKIELKPISTIEARIGIQPNGSVQKYFTNSCYRYMSSFVPGGVSSHLNQNVSIQSDMITYLSPDSHYHYIGKLYVDPKYKKGAFYSQDYGFWSRPGITKIPTTRNLKYHVPGTGSQWDKRMWTSKGNEVLAELQEYVDRR